MGKRIKIITDIQRMSLDDGPGIRTTVFFQGCPLRCIWCHNPECIEEIPTPDFEAHWNKSFERDAEEWDLSSLLLRDKRFYEASGGGVTFSGGEPLLHTDYIMETGIMLRKHRIHITVDTCGYASWNVMEKVSQITDLFLYDLKTADPLCHKLLTGQSNELIWENLTRLLKTGKHVWIRIPAVEGGNRQEIQDIIDRLPLCKEIERVELLKYHKYGLKKYEQLKIPYRAHFCQTPADEVMEELKKRLCDRGFAGVIR